VLWRRLFVHRWGKNVRHSNAQGWKVGEHGQQLAMHVIT
jgi:hypothetical protein